MAKFAYRSTDQILKYNPEYWFNLFFFKSCTISKSLLGHTFNSISRRQLNLSDSALYFQVNAVWWGQRESDQTHQESKKVILLGYFRTVRTAVQDLSIAKLNILLENNIIFTS